MLTVKEGGCSQFTLAVLFTPDSNLHHWLAAWNRQRQLYTYDHWSLESCLNLLEGRGKTVTSLDVLVSVDVCRQHVAAAVAAAASWCWWWWRWYVQSGSAYCTLMMLINCHCEALKPCLTTFVNLFFSCHLSLKQSHHSLYYHCVYVTFCRPLQPRSTVQQ